VVQDGTYSYVYGLDLISAIDGSGTEIYYLYDGLGSVSEITDDSGVVTDTTTYDVFGGVRSSTGSTENVWLFTGEQSDGALAVEFIEAEVIDTVVSSTNLTGATVANLDEDPDAPDADWATATALGNTELRIGFPTPSDVPVTGAGLQEFRVLLRKDAATGTDPTYSIELWETGGGAALATLASSVTLTSEAGTVVSVTWDASLLGTADGSAVELRIIGTASVDRSVEIGAVEWRARVPGGGADLYFLRARYYDPATGRFIGRDPIGFAQRYAYAGNNPVAFTDPSGLEYLGSQNYGPSFGGLQEVLGEDVFYRYFGFNDYYGTHSADTRPPYREPYRGDPMVIGAGGCAQGDSVCASGSPGMGGQQSEACATSGRDCRSDADLALYPALPGSRVSGAGTDIVSPVLEFAGSRTWECYWYLTVSSGGVVLLAFPEPATSYAGVTLLTAMTDPVATACSDYNPR
jgi:hypothetical protein